VFFVAITVARRLRLWFAKHNTADAAITVATIAFPIDEGPMSKLPFAGLLIARILWPSDRPLSPWERVRVRV
jgi:hypothetical protein